MAEEVVANMAYGLMPAGPVRRAVVFGGSNMHIFSDQYTGHTVDRKAANAFIAFYHRSGVVGQELGNWTGSNPGNLQGFKTDGMKQRLDSIKFLDVTTSMLPYGVPFPVIPESTEIMNNIVPNMLQNALTGKMTVKEAADDAAEKIKNADRPAQALAAHARGAIVAFVNRLWRPRAVAASQPAAATRQRGAGRCAPSHGLPVGGASLAGDAAGHRLPVRYTIDLSFYETPPSSRQLVLQRRRQLPQILSDRSLLGDHPQHVLLGRRLDRAGVLDRLGAALVVQREFFGRGMVRGC